MAAICGHELAHIALNHVFTPPPASTMDSVLGAGLGLVTSLATLGNVDAGIAVSKSVTNRKAYAESRSQEFDADSMGVIYIWNAGFDPSAMIRMRNHMDRLHGSFHISFLSDHPSSSDAIQAIKSLIIDSCNNGNGYLNKKAYQQCPVLLSKLSYY